MERHGERHVIVMLYLSLLACFTASAATASISADVLNSSGSTGRRLLQQATQCKADFEFANYTVVTSKCKAPKYPTDVCCSAFKELVCQYANDINDLNSNCADVMFGYLNAAGQYPDGLFSNICHDGKEGLDCIGVAVIGNQTSASVGMRPSSAVIFLVGSLSAFLLF